MYSSNHGGSAPNQLGTRLAVRQLARRVCFPASRSTANWLSSKRTGVSGPMSWIYCEGQGRALPSCASAIDSPMLPSVYLSDGGGLFIFKSEAEVYPYRGL